MGSSWEQTNLGMRLLAVRDHLTILFTSCVDQNYKCHIVIMLKQTGCEVRFRLDKKTGTEPKIFV